MWQPAGSSVPALCGGWGTAGWVVSCLDGPIGLGQPSRLDQFFLRSEDWTVDNRLSSQHRSKEFVRGKYLINMWTYGMVWTYGNGTPNPDCHSKPLYNREAWGWQAVVFQIPAREVT